MEKLWGNQHWKYETIKELTYKWKWNKDSALKKEDGTVVMDAVEVGINEMNAYENCLMMTGQR